MSRSMPGAGHPCLRLQLEDHIHRPFPQLSGMRLPTTGPLPASGSLSGPGRRRRAIGDVTEVA